jgi:hypothetical protein
MIDICYLIFCLCLSSTKILNVRGINQPRFRANLQYGNLLLPEGEVRVCSKHLQVCFSMTYHAILYRRKSLLGRSNSGWHALSMCWVCQFSITITVIDRTHLFPLLVSPNIWHWTSMYSAVPRFFDGASKVKPS